MDNESKMRKGSISGTLNGKRKASVQDSGVFGRVVGGEAAR